MRQAAWLGAFMLALSSAAVRSGPPAEQAPARPTRMPYGTSITLAQAKAVAAAAEAAALRAHEMNMAIAVTDVDGELVYYEQLDDTSTGIRDVAVQKARFSARFRMPTSYVGEMKRAGNDALLALPGAVAGAGGVTLTAAGHTIGGLGVSGSATGGDGVVAEAGAVALR